MIIRPEEALEYHARPRPGKLEVLTSKPCLTQRDLALAYTPGVAVPCREIEHDPEAVYRYTTRGNLVAVISNGTAVLGLGDIGPLASKPVMEGKATLFKRFADIDVFDLELDAKDPDDFIRAVRTLEPTFGGINLEDIKAPECFYIEEQLRAQMSIPVFHDDQHGTAIISAAALLNALDLAGKRIDQVRIVFSGAGAAAIACADMYVKLGVRPENVLMVDTVGVIYRGRVEKMNAYKERFAADTPLRTLAEAIRGADVFVGVSVAGVVTGEMLLTMADSPIVFALSNPDPEISYDLAVAARHDVIMATGRSDYPNQVNNVLGFPFIFRGALDVRATTINDEMKIAAARALAALAREEVPDQVLKAYGLTRLRFGSEYLIPKPFDPRVLLRVAPAVAEAAMATGVARQPIHNLDAYRERLERTFGPSQKVMQFVVHKAREQAPHRIVFAEGEDEATLRAAEAIVDRRIARPVLLGRPAVIAEKVAALGLDLEPCVINPDGAPELQTYEHALYMLRQRKGMTRARAAALVRDPTFFGLLMVRLRAADGFIGGLRTPYPEIIRPALQIIGVRDGVSRVSALHLLVLKDRLFFCADTMVNIDPSAEDLAEMACLAADTARFFDIEPRIAVLAFSSFGSVRHPTAARAARAVQLALARRPDLVIDGEMHLDPAVVEEIARETYPHSRIRGDANVLIFPDLTSANIGYKLVQRLARAETIGPILMGLRRPVSVLLPGTTVSDIVNMAAIAAATADLYEPPARKRSHAPAPALATIGLGDGNVR
jgi:malate dehydrogenase (oxaloacetate-decarboxylating)(NADP+)